MTKLRRKANCKRGAALADARRLVASDAASAEKQACKLLAGEPNNASALRVLGASLRRQGKSAEAAVADHRALEISTRHPLHRAAAQALKIGDRANADALLRRLLSEDESDVLALTLLGLEAAKAREFGIAEQLLRRAVAVAPDEPGTRMALAEMLQHSRRPALALAEIDSIGPIAARTEAVQSLRAQLLNALGRFEEELVILKQLAADVAPNDVRYGLRIGQALRPLGREAEAVAAYRAVARQVPAEGTAWWNLANLKTVRFEDCDVAAMEAALAMPNVAVQNSIRLNFALGKAYEDCGEAETAFHHYAEGNRLRATFATYDPKMVTEWVDRSVALFTPAFFTKRRDQGAFGRDPIFIVGIQRSGSTLVEQILASHPAIEGTAELAELPIILRGVGEEAARANERFELYFSSLSADRLRALGQSYLDNSRVQRSTERPFFTDKLPNNWMHLGLLRTILPSARIIDVRREPLSCCFSNWKQLYAQGLDHSNRLETMGQYYAEYVRLMRHFDAAQAGMVHRVIYDDLVIDLEHEVRCLLDYLDLPFDSGCLDFHSNNRAVRTISAGQVRKPINRDGIGQWRQFEPWLDPLKDALGDTLEHWRG